MQPHPDVITSAFIAGVLAFITGACFCGLLYNHHYLFAIVGACSAICTVAAVIAACTIKSISSDDDEDLTS